MPHSNYKLAKSHEIPEMLRAKFLLLENNTFVHKKTNKPVATYIGNEENHAYMRVYYEGKTKSLAVHRAIWMYLTGCPIPDDFEIHHIDQNNQNNNWDNLLCVHKLDHLKLHQETDTPF